MQWCYDLSCFTNAHETKNGAILSLQMISGIDMKKPVPIEFRWILYKSLWIESFQMTAYWIYCSNCNQSNEMTFEIIVVARK